MVNFVAKKVANKLLWTAAVFVLVYLSFPLFSSKNVLVSYNNPIYELLR